MKVIATLLAILLLFGGTGCRRQPSDPPTHTPGTEQGTGADESHPPQHSAEGTPETDPQLLSSATRILDVLGWYRDESWESPRWAGVDGDDKLVVGGRVDWPTLEDQYLNVAYWFQPPAVDRVLLEGFGDVPFYSEVTRAHYENWGMKEPDRLPFAVSEWSRRVALHAERHGPDPYPDVETQRAIRQAWITDRLGDRLLELRVEPPEPGEVADKLRLRVAAGNLDEHQRLREAAALAAIGNLLHVSTLEVQYEGVEKVRSVVVRYWDFVTWGEHGGNVDQLAEYFEVDGFRPEHPPGPEPRPFTAQRLAELLGRRAELEQLLPAGSRLIIGQKGGKGGPGPAVLVISAAVPAGQDREETWRQYYDVTAQLIARVPDLITLHLFLHRGNEVEAFSFFPSWWTATRNLDRFQAKDVPAAALTLIGRYERYTVVTPEQ